MRVAIVGCGIGGLAAASLGRDLGFDVTVFEEFAAPRPVGSGLVLQPIVHQVFKKIGVLDQILDQGAQIYYMEGTDVISRRRVLDVTYGPVEGPTFGLGIHRAALFDILYKAAQKRGVEFAFGNGVTASSVSDGLRQLEFKDGTHANGFDLVIDAAGSGSPLSPLVGRDLPYGAVWATVDWPKNTGFNYHSLQQTYRRAHNMIGILPLGVLPGDDCKKAGFFWSLPVADYQVWRDTPFADWQAEAKKLWPALAPFVNQLSSHDDLTMAAYTHGTMRNSRHEKMVHIGDASHRASPQLGQGANMALLDAFGVMRALELYPVEQALHVHVKARRLHVGIYQWMSWLFTPMYQSSSRILPILRDHIFAPMSRIPPTPWLLSKVIKGTFTNPFRGLPKD